VIIHARPVGVALHGFDFGTLEIIRLYGWRFKIEVSFKQAFTRRAYAYHFWMQDMKPIGRRRPAASPPPAEAIAKRSAQLAAYERHINWAARPGLLQYLAVTSAAPSGSISILHRTASPQKPLRNGSSRTRCATRGHNFSLLHRKLTLKKFLASKSALSAAATPLSSDWKKRHERTTLQSMTSSPNWANGPSTCAELTPTAWKAAQKS